MALYHAQIEFRSAHGRWAASTGELTLLAKESYPFETPPAISLTGSGYIASVTIRLPGGTKVSWFVTEDSRLWHQ